MTLLFSRDIFVSSLNELSAPVPEQIHVFEKIDSTSNELSRRLKAGAPHNTTVIANRQTNGRGRMGRSWHSEITGNLFISTALVINGPTKETVPLLPLAGGIAVHEAVKHVGANCELKWPNDLLVSRKKLAGLLFEAHMLKDEHAIVIAGLGLNIVDVTFPTDIALTAVSLNSVLKREVEMSSVAAQFLAYLMVWKKKIENGCRNELVQEWKKRAEPFGRRVKVGEVVGTTVDLTPHGHLIVQNDKGEFVEIVGGIVESIE